MERSVCAEETDTHRTRHINIYGKKCVRVGFRVYGLGFRFREGFQIRKGLGFRLYRQRDCHGGFRV
jgi:hypothetical protein